MGAFALLRRGPAALPGPDLVPGSRIADLEARLAGHVGSGDGDQRRLPDPQIQVRDRARSLVKKDPARAAQILRAWMTEDARDA
jgi:flagellar biosynthesis/type III secretory pathway M-ring protein FliF/YscJ